jgi:hypothetical protein
MNLRSIEINRTSNSFGNCSISISNTTMTTDWLVCFYCTVDSTDYGTLGHILHALLFDGTLGHILHALLFDGTLANILHALLLDGTLAHILHALLLDVKPSWAARMVRIQPTRVGNDFENVADVARRIVCEVFPSMRGMNHRIDTLVHVPHIHHLRSHYVQKSTNNMT